MSSATLGRQRARQASPGVFSVPERHTTATEVLPHLQQQCALVRSPCPRRCAALGTPPPRA
eukprot:5059057-Lingulodinium_polyedra.AAC.1